MIARTIVPTMAAKPIQIHYLLLAKLHRALWIVVTALDNVSIIVSKNSVTTGTYRTKRDSKNCSECQEEFQGKDSIKDFGEIGPFK